MASGDELIEPRRGLGDGVGPRHRDHVESARPRLRGERPLEGSGAAFLAQKSRSA
jgi:hypothetical protein